VGEVACPPENLIASGRKNELIPLKSFLSALGFLVYVCMTYSFLWPYIKLLHLTANTWRGGRDSFGWKAYKPWKPQAWETAQESAATQEGMRVGKSKKEEEGADVEGGSTPTGDCAGEANFEGEREEVEWMDMEDNAMSRSYSEGIWEEEDSKRNEELRTTEVAPNTIPGRASKNITITGGEEPPETVLLVPGALTMLLAMKKLLHGPTPLMIAIRAWTAISLVYGFADASGEGFGSWLSLQESGEHMHRKGFWCTSMSKRSSNYREFNDLLLAIKKKAAR
jgi:hypothetical protein